MILRMTIVQLVLAVVAAIAYLGWRSRLRRPTFIDALVTWVLFIVAAVIGEFLSHRFFSDTYAPLGDSPRQITGFLITALLSVPIVTTFWLSARALRKS